MTRTPRRHRRGIFLTDAVVALGLLMAVAVLLVTARTAASKVMRQTDDRRAAVRAAERFLIDAAAANTTATVATTTVATTTAKTQATPAGTLTVSELPTPAPAGWKWVSVRASVNDRPGELVGLVRRER